MKLNDFCPENTICFEHVCLSNCDVYSSESICKNYLENQIFEIDTDSLIIR